MAPAAPASEKGSREAASAAPVPSGPTGSTGSTGSTGGEWAATGSAERECSTSVALAPRRARGLGRRTGRTVAGEDLVPVLHQLEPVGPRRRPGDDPGNQLRLQAVGGDRGPG